MCACMQMFVSRAAPLRGVVGSAVSAYYCPRFMFSPAVFAASLNLRRPSPSGRPAPSLVQRGFHWPHRALGATRTAAADGGTLRTLVKEPARAMHADATLVEVQRQNMGNVRVAQPPSAAPSTMWRQKPGSQRNCFELHPAGVLWNHTPTHADAAWRPRGCLVHQHGAACRGRVSDEGIFSQLGPRPAHGRHFARWRIAHLHVFLGEQVQDILHGVEGISAPHSLVRRFSRARSLMTSTPPSTTCAPLRPSGRTRVHLLPLR